MWSLLATLTAFSGKVPSLLLTSMTFFIGTIPGVVIWIKHPQTLKDLKQPFIVWVVGIGGLFGYHFLYFTALRNAPPVDAALINYLWPLLIVLGSALMPGEKLRWFHVLGALLGFSGMVLVIAGKGGFVIDEKKHLWLSRCIGKCFCMGGLFTSFTSIVKSSNNSRGSLLPCNIYFGISLPLHFFRTLHFAGDRRTMAVCSVTRSLSCRTGFLLLGFWCQKGQYPAFRRFKL